MMGNSRRNFFRSILPSGKIRKEVSQGKDSCHKEETLTLGHLAVFPVHSKTKVKLNELEFLVESLPEGVRLRDEEANKNFKLSLNSSGLLQAHLNEEWPASAVLSIFTGEIYNI